MNLLLRFESDTVAAKASKTVTPSTDCLFAPTILTDRGPTYQAIACSLGAHILVLALLYVASLNVQQFPVVNDLPSRPAPPHERARLLWIPLGDASAATGGLESATSVEKARGSAESAPQTGPLGHTPGSQRPRRTATAEIEPPLARFQLPAKSANPNVKQTVVQPDLPPTARPDLAITVPNIAIVSQQTPQLVKPTPKRFVALARVRPRPSPARIALPGGLELAPVDDGQTPEALPDELRAELPAAPPKPVDRYRPPTSPTYNPPDPQPAGQLDSEPIHVVAVSNRPPPLLNFLVVPEINQVAPSRSGSGGTGGLGDFGNHVGEKAPRRRGADAIGRGDGAVESSDLDGDAENSGENHLNGRNADAKGTGTQLAAVGLGSDPVGRQIDPGSFSVFRGEPGLDAGAESGVVGGLPESEYPIRMLHPENGRFDVVVVQSGSNGAIPGGEDAIKGRPIFTVYITVGERADWILQYAPASDEKAGSDAHTQVITLDNPAPMEAPYPIETVVPPRLPRLRRDFLMIHGVLDANGRWKGLKVLGGKFPEFEVAALPAFMEWRFRPATRDGVPIAVEVLIAIPPALG